MTELEQKYINHLENCFDKAERKESKLIQEVHDIEGMTGEMTRHFYNNLLEMEDARYLEIGVWQGSSTCSAMYGNKATVVAIDNFSNFGSPKNIFLNNFEKYKGENNSIFYDADCFSIEFISDLTMKIWSKNIELVRKFNIYLFDGNHDDISQCKALTYYQKCLDDLFIFIVDDWNWRTVREGTYNGILMNRLEIVWNKEIRLTQDDKFTHNHEEAKNTWWNGAGVFLLKKFK